jgi:hypothetical protein
MKIGILLDNLMASQKAFSILSNPNPAYLFLKQPSPLCIPSDKPISCWHDIWSFEGAVMATDFESAFFLSKLPISDRYFYLWDLEWIRNHGSKHYIRNISVLQDKSIKLLSRSESHSRVIENYCGVKPHQIIENFHYEQLQSV